MQEILSQHTTIPDARIRTDCVSRSAENDCCFLLKTPSKRSSASEVKQDTTMLALGHAFGRIGCFFAGCYGISWKHGVVYHSTVGFTPIGVPLLPIQLIEAGTLLVLFAVQLFLFLHRHRIGRNTVFYFFAYPAVRFVLAFFRSDAERGKLLGSSTSQWGSVLIIGILIAGIIIRRHRFPMPKHRRRLPEVIHSARVGIKKIC